MTRLSFYGDGATRPATSDLMNKEERKMACYECNFFYYDECEGCETCHYEQESQEVELWLAELSYDEPDHLAWLEELDMEESEVLKDDNY